MRMLMVSMGCGGSRSATIEPRYYESRDTESTWLTNTDTDITQLAGTAHGPNGTGDSATDSEHTAAIGSGKAEDQPMTVSKSSCVKDRKLVNTGTQCCRHSSTSSTSQRKPAQREELKNKSKKISREVAQSPVPL